MKMSAPIYHLKRKARKLSRAEDMPLYQALDRIALEEGYGGWSLLAAKAAAEAPAGKLFQQLRPGDLLLVGARPGHGKTLMGLELAVEAMKSGRPGVFFSLEYTEEDIVDRFRAIGVDRARFERLFEFDGSDAISSAYIAERLAAARHARRHRLSTTARPEAGEPRTLRPGPHSEGFRPRARLDRGLHLPDRSILRAIAKALA